VLKALVGVENNIAMNYKNKENITAALYLIFLKCLEIGCALSRL
jgi:hypothetical protein